MSKQNNQAIKLFGKTISLRSNIDMVAIAVDDDHHQQEQQSSSLASTKNKSTSGDEFSASIQEIDPVNPTEEDSVERRTTSTGAETLKTLVVNSDTLSNKDTITEDKTESSDSVEMMMKKPEKILPCPRCSSMDTKFCYYNNYNVKQPRHFCKNCQRFWTAGGTMRNMAVGSGRRKSKGNCPSNPDLTKHPELLLSAQGYGTRPSHWNVVHFNSPAPQDATFPSSFALNFYPTNSHCISAVPGTERKTPLPSPGQFVAHTDPTSSFRKHLRDGSLQSDSTDVGSGSQRYVMPNKALKIDDINDAATPSIMSSMDVKNRNEGSFMGHFKAFYPIHYGKNHMADNSLILQANPAAFSRSMNFHELY